MAEGITVVAAVDLNDELLSRSGDVHDAGPDDDLAAESDAELALES